MWQKKKTKKGICTFILNKLNFILFF